MEHVWKQDCQRIFYRSPFRIRHFYDNGCVLGTRRLTVKSCSAIGFGNSRVFKVSLLWLAVIQELRNWNLGIINMYSLCFLKVILETNSSPVHATVLTACERDWNSPQGIPDLPWSINSLYKLYWSRRFQRTFFYYLSYLGHSLGENVTYTQGSKTYFRSGRLDPATLHKCREASGQRRRGRHQESSILSWYWLADDSKNQRLLRSSNPSPWRHVELRPGRTGTTPGQRVRKHDGYLERRAGQFATSVSCVLRVYIPSILYRRSSTLVCVEL